MGGIEAISSVALAQGSQLREMQGVDMSASSGVSVEAGQSNVSDFAKVLDAYRARAEVVDVSIASARNGGPAGPASQQQMLQQLTDLYSYAVDTQLLVKTSGQLTQSARQLVTGQ